MEKTNSILILDSNSLTHRSYHALPPLSTKQGEATNAIYGFLLMLFKAINDFQPRYLAACFDFPSKNFRHDIYNGYKGKRIKAPDELYTQIPKIKEILGIVGIKIYEKQGVEADDLIASIPSSVKGVKKVIVSGDLDNTQLVDEETIVYSSGKKIKDTLVYDRQKVLERFGVFPENIVDYKSLVGDSSDNIPGGKGIGPKKAVELIKEHGGIIPLLEKIEKGESWDLDDKNKKLLLENRESIRMSYTLAKMRTDCLPEFSLEECEWLPKNKDQAINWLTRYELYTLISRLPFE